MPPSALHAVIMLRVNYSTFRASALVIRILNDDLNFLRHQIENNTTDLPWAIYSKQQAVIVFDFHNTNPR